jgi:hypothetical protein
MQTQYQVLGQRVVANGPEERIDTTREMVKRGDGNEFFFALFRNAKR